MVHSSWLKNAMKYEPFLFNERKFVNARQWP